MDRNEIPHDAHHLGVQSGASKTISRPMVLSSQTMHLSYVKISTTSKQTEMSLAYFDYILNYIDFALFDYILNYIVLSLL
jgi:hypothetical protein